MLIIPALEKLRQQDYRFEDNLSYSEKSCLQKRDGKTGWRSVIRGKEKSQLSHRDIAMSESPTNAEAIYLPELVFWNIPDVVPWLSSESQYHTLPGLIKNDGLKELSEELGGWSLERSKDKAGKKRDPKQLQHPLPIVRPQNERGEQDLEDYMSFSTMYAHYLGSFLCFKKK